MLVFADTDDDESRASALTEALTEAFPGSRVTRSRIAACASGPTAFVAWPEVLDLYQREFPGSAGRARDRTRETLAPLEAVYLPVTYSAWLVVIRSPDDLPVALETARLLHVDTVVCPAFDPGRFQRCTRAPRGATAVRHQDRVRLESSHGPGPCPGPATAGG